MKYSKLILFGYLLCFMAPKPVCYGRDAAASAFAGDNRSAFFQSLTVPQKQIASSRPQVEYVGAGVKVERHAEHDGAQIIHKPNGFLTGPVSVGQAGLLGPRLEARDVVATFMNRQAAVLGHDAGVLTNAILVRDYVSSHNHLHTMMWVQQHLAIPIHGAHYAAHVTARGELVNISGHMFPDAPQAVRAGAKARKVVGTGRSVSASQALIRAAHAGGENLDDVQQVVGLRGKPVGSEQRQFLQSPSVINEACVHLTWLPMDAETLRLCWDVTWMGRKSHMMYRSFVDAETGEIWMCQSLTRHTVPEYRVYGSHSPTPMMPGYSAPNSAQPSEAARVLVDSSTINTNASPAGWINPGTDITVGNNVDAFLDANHDNLPDASPRTSAANLVFDFPLQLDGAPTTYNDAITVNSFFWCNWMHDRLFELGFTEQAGNMQTTNFSGSTGGNDAVKVLVNYGANDLFDFNYQNVAAMSTPSDGQTPYLYLGLFVGPNPDRASALDVDAVLHEYTHGMTDRLVGRQFGVTMTNTMAMDEGWSDFMSLCLLSQPQEDLGGNFPFAAYLSYFFGGFGTQNYYFGIRRFPYSTNLSANPLTFRDILPSQADPHFGVPRNPMLLNTADEVHNAGEVWCSLLWEMRANLIQKLGFTNGNHLAMQLVVDGQKLGPINPTFLQARDAILQAEQVLCNGTNRLDVWRAFAKRGLGASATILISGNKAVDLEESFELPGALSISTEPILAYGVVGGPFIAMTNIFQIVNTSTNTVNWTAASENLVTVRPASGALAAGQTGLVTFAFTAIPNSFSNGFYTNIVNFVDDQSGIALTRRIFLMVGHQPLVETFTGNRFDLQYTTLTFTPDATETNYSVCRMVASNFPTDLTDTNILAMGDDTYALVDLTDGQSVAVMGYRTNRVYIVSNGHLSLQLGLNDAFYPSPDEMHAHYRAIGFYQDLNPAAGGVVSYKQLADRFVTTWLNVPEYGSNNVNNLQIELFFDGRIRMTWLQTDSNPLAVGLVDDKGVPKYAPNRDFSATDVCDPALQLTIPAQATEGNGMLTNQGLVAIVTPLETNLVVALQSSETNKLRVPDSVTIPAGELTAAFNLEVMDLSNLDGDLTIRVMATTTNYASARALMVVKDNDPPNIFLEVPGEVTEGQGTLTNAGRLSVVGPMVTNLLFRLTSSVPAKVSLPASLLLTAGQTSIWFNLNIQSNQIPNEQTVVSVGVGGPGLFATNQLLVVKDSLYQLLFLPTNTVGGSLRMEWPDYASNYVLESAALLGSNAWQNVSNGISITNGYRVLSLPMDQSNQFFRLRRP